MDLEPTLRDYWRVLFHHRWTVLGVLGITFVSTVVYTAIQSPVYRAEGVVKFEPPGPKPLLTTDVPGMDEWTAVQTQVRLLLSRDMAERVANKLGWPIEEVQRSYQAQREEQSNLIAVSGFASNPKAAMQLTQTLMEEYISADLEERSRQTKQALQDVLKRRDEEEEALRQVEERRAAFLERHTTTSGGDTSLAGSFIELESKRRELLKAFTPEYPEIQKLDQRIAALKSRLTRMPGEKMELERLDRDLKVHEEVYITLFRQVQELKIALASTVPYVTVVSHAVLPKSAVSPNRRVNYLLGLLCGLILGLFAAFVLESLDVSISTVEGIETVLGCPVLAVIPRFPTDDRWSGIKAALTGSPRLPIDDFRSMLAVHQQPNSPYVEVYHSLRANIYSRLPRPQNAVIVFTSAGGAEGKTLTAVNFCLAAAHVGLSTLLVGADARRPMLHQIFGLSRRQGFLEVLSGKASWKQALQGTPEFHMDKPHLDRLLSFPGIERLKIITDATNNPGEVMHLFSSPKLPKAVAEFRSHFDLVVFDCPPAMLFADAMLIGPHADGVVLVYRSGKLERATLKRTKDQVLAAKANILGVVLNDVHTTELLPGYGYYNDYTRYAKQPGA